MAALSGFLSFGGEMVGKWKALGTVQVRRGRVEYSSSFRRSWRLLGFVYSPHAIFLWFEGRDVVTNLSVCVCVQQAVNALEGRLFNGNTIEARFFDKDKFEDREFD